MERRKEYVHGKESFSVWYKFGYRKGLLSMYVLLALLNFLQSNDKFSVPVSHGHRVEAGLYTRVDHEIPK